MKRLIVLFDVECGFCCRVKVWMERQKQRVPIIFLARQSAYVAMQYPGVVDPDNPDEMVVISDEGAVYRGTNAYLVCLWALQRYFRWSFRLNTPVLRPLARNFFAWLAKNRKGLGRWLNARRGDTALAFHLGREWTPRCTSSRQEARS